MAEQGDVDVDENTPGYVPPAEKSLDEILSTDADDPSLENYKKTLLGDGAQRKVIIDDSNPNNVIVTKLGLVVEGRPEMELDLTEDLAKIKKKHFVMKEGTMYKVRVYFYVQRELVCGLKYVQKSSKIGIQVDSTKFMVGSYGPKEELYSYTTPVEEAPTGMMARGSYSVKSTFTDDDKKIYLKWEWNLDIKKDWE